MGKGFGVLNGIDRGLNEMDVIEIIRIERACHILRMEGERIPSRKRDSQ